MWFVVEHVIKYTCDKDKHNEYCKHNAYNSSRTKSAGITRVVSRNGYWYGERVRLMTELTFASGASRVGLHAAVAVGAKEQSFLAVERTRAHSWVIATGLGCRTSAIPRKRSTCLQQGHTQFAGHWAMMQEGIRCICSLPRSNIRPIGKA